MTYSEDEYLLLSGIQHFCFCKRQWALIHLEQQWLDNHHTVKGEIMHKKVHDPFLVEKRKDVIIARSIPVSSKELGIIGECDVVEFRKNDDGVAIKGHRGLYSVYPVEYKKGKPKAEDVFQLVAQAICLEEKFSKTIKEGAIYYGKTRKREIINIDDKLRNDVKEMVHEMHGYFDKMHTPKAKYRRNCKECSLFEICMPNEIGNNSSVKDYLEKSFKD